MARIKFVGIAVTLGAVTIEGFKNQAQAEAFHEEVKKATLKAFRKVTDMPKELDPDTFEAMTAQIVGLLPATESNPEGLEIDLDELDGTVKLRKAGEPTTEDPSGEPETDDDSTPPSELPEAPAEEVPPSAPEPEAPEGEPEKPKRTGTGRKQADTDHA